MQRILFFLFLTTLLWGSANGQTYFQQEVNYTIEVELDDVNHMLSGVVYCEYTNNAPDELPFLFFHLWGNSFQDRNTAFARQKLRTGSTGFHYADEEERGGYQKVAFWGDGALLVHTLDEENPDVAKVMLAQPLQPGATIKMEIPFVLRVPASFSRLGRVGTSYQMTQWYPKPAVYDQNGWHEMPYLDMGEFYSEFGAFDVSITLPANYVVGATGVLQTASEQQFLDSLAQVTRETFEENPPEELSDIELKELNKFPPSSPEKKTIRYTAEQVHDFAWFADKRFQVLKDAVEVEGGGEVTTWAFFTREEEWLWKDATDYLNRSVAFYSEKVGPYPYPHATAVQSALSAGAGMEYPMITVIGTSGNARALDNVITHEVGHNWFYGILASNERDYAWMDEGLNSYYEHRYMEENYEETSILDQLPEFLTGGVETSINELGYQVFAKRRSDQACQTHSNHFSDMNYWLGAYGKPALALRQLEGWLGTEEMDRIMQTYYQEWKFRHPGPEDFRASLEKSSGKDLSWLFDGLIESTAHIDYRIQKVETTSEGRSVTVSNEARIAAPFSLSGWQDSVKVWEQWYPGFDGKANLVVPDASVERIVLDADHYTLDINRKNNYYRLEGGPKKLEKMRVALLTSLDPEDRTNLYVTPAFGWNAYNKFQVGLVLHNHSIFEKPVEFMLTPMFSFASTTPTGTGRLHWNIRPYERALDLIQLGVQGQSFAYNYDAESDIHLNYYRLVPHLKLDFSTDPSRKFSHGLTLRSIIVGRENPVLDGDVWTDTEWDNYQIQELVYEGRNKRALHPFGYRLALEQSVYQATLERASYVRLAAEGTFDWNYMQGRALKMRLFAGGFLQNTNSESSVPGLGSFALTGQGYPDFNDYRFDELYFGRSENTGLWSRQITVRDAGFKNAISSEEVLRSGYSNNWMVAANFKLQLPILKRLPFRPYFDIAALDPLFPGAENLEDYLWYSGGVAFELADGLFGIYVPLINSPNLQQLYKNTGQENFYQQITFQLQLRELNPLDLLEKTVF
jgi:hypothetical protein